MFGTALQPTANSGVGHRVDRGQTSRGHFVLGRRRPRTIYPLPPARFVHPMRHLLVRVEFPARLSRRSQFRTTDHRVGRDGQMGSTEHGRSRAVSPFAVSTVPRSGRPHAAPNRKALDTHRGLLRFADVIAKGKSTILCSAKFAQRHFRTHRASSHERHGRIRGHDDRRRSAHHAVGRSPIPELPAWRIRRDWRPQGSH